MFFFRFNLRLHRLHGRALGDHAAIFRHGAGKIFRADLTRQVDDVLFIVRNQRAQDQSIGDIIDQAQVSEGLTGDLAERFAGDQRLHAIAFRDF